MTLERTHPSDQALLRSLDDELSGRRRAALERHLQGCEECRSRLEDIRSAAEGATCAYRAHTDPSNTDALRARVRAGVANLSAEFERSRWLRVVEVFAAVPRVALVGTAVAAAVVTVALVLGPSPFPEPGRQGAAVAESAALPDRSLTPGSMQYISVDDLCAGRVPTARRISSAVRLEVLRDYRMESVPSHEYELDYLITPELGGTADRRNLWPERYASPVWNAKVKDQLENLLPQLVCQGSVDLATAQRDLAANWIDAYKKYFHTQSPVGTEALHVGDDDATGRSDGLLQGFRLRRGTALFQATPVLAASRRRQPLNRRIG